MKSVPVVSALSVLGTVQAGWSKCNAACGGGTQSDENGNERACNFISCDIYDNHNIFSDGRMELTQNSPWSCSNCQATKISVAYGKWEAVDRAV